MLPTTKSSHRRRLGLAVAVTVALVALLGAACQPVRAPGESGFNPTGHLELVEGGQGEVRVAGWATQWVSFAYEQRPTPIVVMVNGQWATGAVPVSIPRPDVHQVVSEIGFFGGMVQPNMGYGFDFTKPAPKGEVTVCVVALNPFMTEWAGTEWFGPPDHVLLGCGTVTVT